jgi:CheY-like chemotaxis protein
VKQSDLMDTIMSVLGSRLPKTRRKLGAVAAHPPKGGRSLRVLVAEDNAVNQQVALGMLERAGHLATVAENGREVLALLERGAFDVVLMDVQMPEMDGLEATAAIRERERATGGHLPIVALTAHAMKGDAERCLEAGMDAYLAKPLQPRELAAAIEGVLGRTPSPAPEPDVPAPTSAFFDLERLLERVGGDRKALVGLVRIFRADSPKQVARIRKAIEEGDAPALRAAAHALKGAVSNFAAPAAAETAQRLQKMGEEGRLQEAGRTLERLEGEIEALLAALADAAGTPARRSPRERTKAKRR